MKATLENQINAALQSVLDPEIPTVSIMDLGLVHDVRVLESSIEIDLLPTFNGCPALDLIKRDVEEAVIAISAGRDVNVTFRTSPPWTTDRMSPAAHEALKDFGVSPPLLHIQCPTCGSSKTTLESSFGPTLCRDIRHCSDCRNPFEGFKIKKP